MILWPSVFSGELIVMFKSAAASLASLGRPYSLVHGGFKIFPQSLYFREIKKPII